MVVEVPLVQAELAGTFIETLFVGAYLVVFFATMYVLFSDRHMRGTLREVMLSPVTISTFILFGSILTHWVLDIARVFDAFIYGKEGNPLFYYALLPEPKNVAKTGLYIVEAITGDIIMVYRLYHIYGRSWKVCLLPIATTIVATVTGLGATVQFALVKPGVEIFTSACGRWIVTAFTGTLITNLYSSSLIAARVWKSHKETSQFKHGSFVSAMKMVIILIESAALYTAFTVITFSAYLSKSALHPPALNITSPVVGFAFCLIVVRVRLFGRTNSNITTVGTKPAPAAVQLYPLSVNIRQDVEVSGTISAMDKTTLHDDHNNAESYNKHDTVV